LWLGLVSPRQRFIGLCLLRFLPGHLVPIRACLAPDPFTVSGPVSRESLIFHFRSEQGSRQVDSSSLCARSISVRLVGFCRFCPRSREVLGSSVGAALCCLKLSLLRQEHASCLCLARHRASASGFRSSAPKICYSPFPARLSL
jgi:hypothetical protein